MKKIKLKLTPYEAKLMFCLLKDYQDSLMQEIDDNDYLNFMHGEIEKILYKVCEVL
jgi:hypothetical protein